MRLYTHIIIVVTYKLFVAGSKRKRYFLITLPIIYCDQDYSKNIVCIPFASYVDMDILLCWLISEDQNHELLTNRGLCCYTTTAVLNI